MRGQFRGNGWFFYLMLLGIMAPGILVGFGFAILMRLMGVELSWDTTTFLVQVSWTLPFGFLTMLAVFNRFDKRVEEAALTLGASRLKHLPPHHPAAGAAGRDRRRPVRLLALLRRIRPQHVHDRALDATLPLAVMAQLDRQLTPEIHAVGTTTTTLFPDRRHALHRRLLGDAAIDVLAKDLKEASTMLIKRRTLLAAAGAPSTLAAPAIAQAKQIQLAGASYDMREAILGEFAKRTGITPRPFVNLDPGAHRSPAHGAGRRRADRRAVRGLRQQREAAAAHRHRRSCPTGTLMHPLLKDGRATPTAPLGFGANPGRMMYVDEARTKVSFAPMFFQMDSIGYNASKIPAENNDAVVGRAVQSQVARQGRHVRHRLAGHAERRHGHARAGPAEPGRHQQHDREGSRHRGRLPQGEEEGGPFPRHVEGLWRAGEPDGLRGGLDRRCLVAGGRRGREQGHSCPLRRRQGGLPRLVQRLRASRPEPRTSTPATSG